MKKPDGRTVSFSDTIKELKQEMELRRREEERKRNPAGATGLVPPEPEKASGSEPGVPLQKFIADVTGRYGAERSGTGDPVKSAPSPRTDSRNLLQDMDLGPFDASEFIPSPSPPAQAPPPAGDIREDAPASCEEQVRLLHETPIETPEEEKQDAMEGDRLLDRLNLGESWKRQPKGAIRDVGPSSIRDLTEREEPEKARSPRGLRTALGRLNPIRILLSRMSGVSAVIPTIPFDPGEISHPTMDESFRDVSITYPVDPPFQFIHIEFDKKEGALVYSIREPALSTEEVKTLGIIERAFEKLISTEGQLVSGMNREAYLKERFFSIVHIFDIRLSDEQKEKLFFHLKKRYLGFGIIDSLMKDRYIEDISCNGPNADLYILHRIYGSIRTNIRYGDVELNNFVLRLAQVAGRHISLLQPIRDVSLPDGSRANLTLGG
ncbi:MAG TPA: hypothetical protein VLU98_05135, partial [Methanomicrobiales archaeon]|nr:hypothetical protein [Methanomicrobiales archaeon]